MIPGLSSALIQATDEDSPPNNQITYSIVSASEFRSYFDISIYEGYGGEHCWGTGRVSHEEDKQETEWEKGLLLLRRKGMIQLDFVSAWA